MSTILVATVSGLRTFKDGFEGKREQNGRRVTALATAGSAVVVVIDEREIWQRSDEGVWSRMTTSDIELQSIAAVDGTIFGGGMAEASVVCVSNDRAERLTGFDDVAGREEWYAGGPPLGVRSLTSAANGKTIFAAVHVGGIPRSVDDGKTWAPTIPIDYDVHEVCTHRSKPIVAAATAIGLCVSEDDGQHWRVLNQGLEVRDSLAVAVLGDEVLFSVQDGPFAGRSQIWRWSIGTDRLQQVRDGLPEWLDGKVDTAHIAANAERAAVIDEGGNMWASGKGSADWKRIATEVRDVCGVIVL